MTKCKKGYKEFYGKCSKKIGFMNNFSGSSYKPWRMWGSWIGAVSLFLISLIFYKKAVSDLNYSTYCWISNCYTGHTWAIFPAIIILGFLAGWGINSLIRRFLK